MRTVVDVRWNSVMKGRSNKLGIANAANVDEEADEETVGVVVVAIEEGLIVVEGTLIDVAHEGQDLLPGEETPEIEYRFADLNQETSILMFQVAVEVAEEMNLGADHTQAQYHQCIHLHGHPPLLCVAVDRIPNQSHHINDEEVHRLIGIAEATVAGEVEEEAGVQIVAITEDLTRPQISRNQGLQSAANVDDLLLCL